MCESEMKMKKTIENLLFSILENSDIKLNTLSEIEKSFLSIDSVKDPLRVKVYQATYGPDNVRIEFGLRSQLGKQKNEIILPAKKIENFLYFIQHRLEKEEEKNKSIIEEYGQGKFNELKEDILNILAKKPSKNFVLIDNYQSDEGGNYIYNLEDKVSGIDSFIVFKENQSLNNIIPLNITFQTVIKCNEKLKTASLSLYISVKDLNKYPLLPHKAPHQKTEEEFLDDIIKKQSHQSKVLNHFALSVILPEKDEIVKVLKI